MAREITKKFPKPDRRRIALTIILSLLILWLGYPHFYPLDFYEVSSVEGSGNVVSLTSPVNLIIDILCLCIISALILSVCDKLRTKR